MAAQARQGDVLLNPIKSIPAGYKKINPAGKVILASGEMTNHHHVISDLDGVDVYVADDGSLCIEAKKEIKVTHEEHGALFLSPGKYEVRRQYEEFMDEVRQVMD